MKNRTTHIILLVIVLLTSTYIYPQQKSQIHDLKDPAKQFALAESIKAYETKVARIMIAEANNPMVQETIQKVWESARGLNKEQATKLFRRLASSSKSSIKTIIKLSPSQMRSYVKDVTGRIKLSPRTLKQILYGTGDKAGNALLTTFSEMDEVLAKTGKIPRKMFQLLKSEASGLDPKRARAFYDLLKKKAQQDWVDIFDVETPGKGPGSLIGTLVDGALVLKDAWSIYYSDEDPEIKWIKSSAKIIDYGASTGAGVASAALGGGLGPGLVIALSANRVSTLYTEVLMLEREKNLAADNEAFERINNAILIRRQLINISNKIKLGQIDNARFLNAKVQQFILKHNFDNGAMLLQLSQKLEDKADSAERDEAINYIINKARSPFQKAKEYYKKGIQLHLAKIHADEALQILKSHLKEYPEINNLEAINMAKKLIVLIDKKIADAPEFSIKKIIAPKRVYIGQNIDIVIVVSGGIPFYHTAGISGNISNDEVTAYWQAPSNPGIEKLSITVKDCMGKSASQNIQIEVVDPDEEIQVEKPQTASTNPLIGTWKFGYEQIGYFHWTFQADGTYIFDDQMNEGEKAVSGHYSVEGNKLFLINKKKCGNTKGVYPFIIEDKTDLKFSQINDACFQRSMTLDHRWEKE